MEITEIKSFLSINKVKNLDVFFDYETRNLSTFRLKGKCPIFIIANSVDALFYLLSFLERYKINYYIIGRGSNTLIGSCGNIIMIKLGKMFDYIEFEDSHIIAGASCNLGRFVIRCAKNKYDFSFLAGIPGTIGGAVSGNCGTQIESLCDYVESIECLKVIKNKIIKEKIRLKSHNYGYRFLNIDNLVVITKVFLKKERADKELIYINIRENILKKKTNQPLGTFNCGCFFKNPLTSRKTAGELIDNLGLKGFSYGGAVISTKHANFIENGGKATPDDIHNLSKIVAGLVSEKYKIKLEHEVKLVGFEN
ncbi:MAG: UDP-N-acetylmuramate dehydrogenase [Actinomycetota bacterium]|nr:UDP-N-acetylmuramate dehydrogenase [Actinomycetota bacterium]